MQDSDQLTRQVIGLAMKVHSALGPGLLESAYEACLVHELRKHELKHQSQVELPINYDGVEIHAGYRLDILVENQLIIELKAVSSITDVHRAQLLSYLKLSNIKVGLLINFHVPQLKQGIVRLVNNF
ncbi:MAG: GxxExxY protein [Fuerstiella sp.]